MSAMLYKQFFLSLLLIPFLFTSRKKNKQQCASSLLSVASSRKSRLLNRNGKGGTLTLCHYIRGDSPRVRASYPARSASELLLIASPSTFSPCHQQRCRYGRGYTVLSVRFVSRRFVRGRCLKATLFFLLLLILISLFIHLLTYINRGKDVFEKLAVIGPMQHQ